MAFVKRLITRTSQPQGLVGIDWSNPITRGLREFVTGKRFSDFGNAVAVTKDGLSAFNTSTFQTVTSPVNEVTIFQSAVFDSISNVSSLGVSSGGDSGFGFKNNTTSVRLFKYRASGTANTQSVSTRSLVVGRRVNVCGTFDGANQRLYEDGVLSSSTANAEAVFWGASPKLRLGGFSVSNFAGTASILLYFARALSDAEIKSLSDNPWQIFAPEVQRVWVDDYISAGGSATVIPIGVQATGSVGTPSATGAATTTPAGVSASSAVGTPVALGGASIPATALPTGGQATGAVGTVSAIGAAVAQPVGVTASGAVGTPVAIAGTSIPATVLPAGVQALGAVGTPTVTAAAIAQPLGVAATAYVGAPTITTGVSGVAVAYPAGVQAIGQVGTLIATGAAWTAAVGVQAVASVGTPTAYAGEIVIYVAGAQTRPSRLQSSSRPSRLQTGTRASR